MSHSLLKTCQNTEDFFIFFESCSPDSEDEGRKIKNVIKSNWFNETVDVVVPGDKLCGIEEIHSQNPQLFEYYKINRLKLSTLINQDFIGAFLRRGAVSLLSLENSLGTNDCVALFPNGCLVLNVCFKTYVSLGLSGKPITSNSKQSQKHVIQIDILSPSFKPGNSIYDQTERAFMTMEQLFTFNASWIPSDSKIHSISMPEYFKHDGATYKSKQVKFKSFNQRNINIPNLEVGWEEVDNDQSEQIEDLYEWFGAVSTNIVCEEEGSGSYLTKFGHLPVMGCVNVVKLVGFISPLLVDIIYSKMKSCLSCMELSWMTLMVHTSENNVVCIDDRKNTIKPPPLNSYTLIPFSDGRCYILRETGIELNS